MNHALQVMGKGWTYNVSRSIIQAYRSFDILIFTERYFTKLKISRPWCNVESAEKQRVKTEN